VSPETSSDSAPIGDRYTLDSTLGSGSAAIVYAGRDLATGQRVAVKVYRAEGAARHRVEQHREIEALTRLRHPGLVALHGGGTEPGPDGRTYLVTELVDGPSLATRLAEGPVPVEDVRTLGAGLADALAHVHAGGFVHRDIKPANILLDRGGAPRLADFGIARALDGTIATATGAVAGTAAYLAPEQVRGERVGAPADVFALGLVLIESLTGKREYPGTMVESATARLYRRPAVPDGLPGDLAALLGAMTDPDPAVRPTAQAVAVVLAAGTPGLHAAAATPRVRSLPRLRERLSLPTLAAAALLVAFLLGGISLLTDAGAPSVASAPTAGSLSPVPLDPPAGQAPPNLGLVGGPAPAPAAPAQAVEVSSHADKAKKKGATQKSGADSED
jgi:eukaryotic-like serine/threonine-protein kinase